MARTQVTRKKLPTDAYDFTNGVLTPWRGTQSITYTRTGTQYTLDSDGYYSGKASNTAAFQYNNGLVLSEQITNNLKNGNDLSNANWTKDRVNTPSAIAGPDNSGTAYLMVPTTENNSHPIYQNSNITSGTFYVMSVLAKAGGYNFLQLTVSTGFQTPATNYVNFNLSTGTMSDVTGAGSITYWIEPSGNGWWRCSIGYTAISTTSGRFLICPLVTGSEGRAPTFAGNGSSGVYLSMVTFSPTVRYPFSYVHTTSAAATLYAPTCSSTVPQYITNGSAFSLCVEVKKHVAATTNKVGTPAVFELKKDANNYYTVLLNQTTANVQQKLVLSGASDFGTDASLSWNKNELVRYVVTFDGASTWKLYANGTLLRTDTATSSFSPTSLELAKTISTMYGSFTYKRVAFWNFAQDATSAAGISTYGW